MSVDLCFLYTIRHKTLPIVYIGLTNDTSRRFAEHKNSCSNKALKLFISTYGTNQFDFRVIGEGPRDCIEELEELAISEAKSLKRLVVCNVVVGSVFTGASTQQGHTHWNARFTEEDVVDIRNIYALGGISQKQIGEIYGCSNKVISKITSGIRWRYTPGSISSNILANRKANRRKLSDFQCVQAREEALQEYLLTAKVDVSDIAEMYEVARGSMRLLLKGEVYEKLGGPLLGKDYYEEYGQ